MRRLSWCAAAAVALIPTAASAESPAEVDLRVRAEPAAEVSGLGMRRDVASITTSALPMAANVIVPVAAETSASASASADTGYKAIPSSWRDVQERVIFKVNVGFGLDSAPTSGDFHKSGFRPDDLVIDGENFVDSRQYLLGDAVLGSRGVLLPSLNTYFLSRYHYDTEGAAGFTGLHNVYDGRDGQDIDVHAAYAEIDGYGEEGTLVNKLFLRAGRQFRLGGARYVSNFDGVTAGYDGDGVAVSGFFGQRVALYFEEDDPGTVMGAGVKIDGKDMFDVPVDAAIDYFNFDGERQYIELSGRYVLEGPGTRLYLKTRLSDNGDIAEESGLGLGRISLRVRHPIGHKYYVTADVEQIFAREAAYDFLSPVGADVVNVGEQVGLGFEPPQDALRFSARVMAILTKDLEAFGFLRANIASDDSVSSFDNSYQEVGLAVQALLGRNARVGGQYKLRATSLNDSAQGAGSLFEDTTGAGAEKFHELSAEFRYSMGYRKMTAAAGAYLRAYDFATPYATSTGDARAGGRVDVDYWLKKTARFKVAGEMAQSSPTFASDLGTVTSVRLIAETVF